MASIDWNCIREKWSTIKEDYCKKSELLRGAGPIKIVICLFSKQTAGPVGDINSGGEAGQFLGFMIEIN